MTGEDTAKLWRDATAAVTKSLHSGGMKTFDPLNLGGTLAEFAAGMAARPTDLFEMQVSAAMQWGDFWTRAVFGDAGEKPRDRRFRAAAWQDDAYFRTIRDSYMLACDQLREVVDRADGSPAVKVMLDQYLNAVSPTNFAVTNPEVIERTIETNGANLAQGFAHMLEDLASGEGIVRRRTDPDAFVKGETIAATAGQVVYENRLFQLLQYTPTTKQVAAEPMLYVPPLVNRYYMMDLTPEQSLVKWLVDQGHTVFVISWVNPTQEHKDCGVAEYVLEGVVEAAEEVKQRTGHAPDLFSFCLGGTLVAIALAWLGAKGRADEVNSATLIGAMVDFADMRDWAAFVHEVQLDALDNHLEKQGYIDSLELQKLFSAMRANDLIWSSVVNHYLLDRPAPPSDLLYWFEDGTRIPAAFLKTYNRELLYNNKLSEPAGFMVGDVAIDLGAVETPVLVIALKDDHVSAWEAVYHGAHLLAADFIMGGSGHNAGVINPPTANRHGFWLNDKMPEEAAAWLAGAEKQEGSWWPYWERWLTEKGSGERVSARKIKDGLEPAPGSYSRAP